MKRDMDLVRKILLALEAHEHGNAPSELNIAGYSEEQIYYHVSLMNEAGLVHAVEAGNTTILSPQAIPMSLSWEGHEFLEAAREPSRWQTALTMAREKGAALTFDILKAILIDISRRALWPAP